MHIQFTSTATLDPFACASTKHSGCDRCNIFQCLILNSTPSYISIDKMSGPVTKRERSLTPEIPCFMEDFVDYPDSASSSEDMKPPQAKPHPDMQNVCLPSTFEVAFVLTDSAGERKFGSRQRFVYSPTSKFRALSL